VLGIVLGDLLEKSLRRGLVLTDGDLTPFFTRPISFVMFVLVAATVLMNISAFHNAVLALWGRIGGMIGRRSGST
jgi:putative tricarboxylic transport membrane protein